MPVFSIPHAGTWSRATQWAQREYKQVVGQNPIPFQDSDQQPVGLVSWLDVVKFCNKLSEREGGKPYYRIEGEDVAIIGGNGYLLPTEAEWEYACRAGNPALYPFGNDASALDTHAWYDENSGAKTHPVGQKRPNAWGLHEMLGNIGEWCQDGYDDVYYKNSPAVDPPGPSGASERVIRGGYWWASSRGGCRPEFRIKYVPERRHHDLGFRVAAVQD